MDVEVDRLIADLIDQLIPPRLPRGEAQRISAITGLSVTTIRSIRNRKNLSADTLLRLLLARGVSPAVLTSLPRTSRSEASRQDTRWAKLGASLSEIEMEKTIELIRFLLKSWRLK